MEPTPAYWPTRILLAIGTLATVVAVVLSVTSPWAEPCFGCDRSWTLGLPSGVVVLAAGVVPPVIGLGWMIRIFRGPRDEPPAWRYRNHD